MDFKQAHQIAHLRIIGLKPTKKNIFEYGLDPDRLVLLEETKKYWIIKRLRGGMTREYIDVVYKATLQMEGLELR